MSDMNAGTAGAPHTRPTLLTVICILSFIAGAWSLIGGIRSAFTDKAQQDLQEAQARMEEARAQMGDQAGAMTGFMDSAMAMAEKAAEKAKPMGYAGIVLALISILGVWWMWNLRKAGFWLYVLASIGGLIVPMVFLGGGWLAMLSVGFAGLISIIFIILYAVNLKYMH